MQFIYQAEKALSMELPGLKTNQAVA